MSRCTSSGSFWYKLVGYTQAYPYMVCIADLCPFSFVVFLSSPVFWPMILCAMLYSPYVSYSFDNPFFIDTMSSYDESSSFGIVVDIHTFSCREIIFLLVSCAMILWHALFVRIFSRSLSISFIDWFYPLRLHSKVLKTRILNFYCSFTVLKCNAITYALHLRGR